MYRKNLMILVLISLLCGSIYSNNAYISGQEQNAQFTTYQKELERVQNALGPLSMLAGSWKGTFSLGKTEFTAYSTGDLQLRDTLIEFNNLVDLSLSGEKLESKFLISVDAHTGKLMVHYYSPAVYSQYQLEEISGRKFIFHQMGTQDSRPFTRLVFGFEDKQILNISHERKSAASNAGFETIYSYRLRKIKNTPAGKGAFPAT